MLHALHLSQIIGGVLVDVVVQPVFIQQMGVRAPAEERRLAGVIVGVVVFGHCNGQALGNIPLILRIQRVFVVLRVADDKDLTAVLGAHQERPCLIALGKDAQRTAVVDILPAHGGVAAVGGIEHLIKAAHQRVGGPDDPVLEHAEHLGRQQLLADAVVVVQARLRTPADCALCNYARNKNVRVLVESCGLFSDTALLGYFVRKADPQTRGVLWDIQHPYRHCGEKPKQTVANLGDEIYYVQVKDSVVDENGEIEYRMMGLGDLPVYDAVRELHHKGYDGYLTLEWLKRWRPELRDPDVIFYHFQTYMETLLAEIENDEK